MGDFVVGKNACPFVGCGSSDGFHWYGEGNGGYCYSCNKSILSDERKAELGIDSEDDYGEEVVTREKITPEENERIKARTGTDGKGYRGISKDINTFFGVRYEYDEESGEPIKQYVPTTIAGELCGYRTRRFPKDFTGPIGQVGKECDMVFQFRFKTHTKTCIISGGETKALNTYKMLYDHQVARGKTDYETVAVVCSTLGESGAHKQVQAQYAFFEQFDRVLVCMDQDDAGLKATEEIVKVLPKGKAWVLKMRYKDADDYVEKGKQQEFINDYYAAKKYVPHGVTASTDLEDKMREYLSIPRISLPPFMHKLQKMLRGGLPVGSICTLLSASGQGKSTFVDAMTLHFIMNTDRTVGVISLEAGEGEYAVNLLSSFMEYKVNLLESVEDRLNFIDSDDASAAKQLLFKKPDGNPRFYVLDAEVDTLKARVEYLIVSLGCNLIVTDPIQDVFDLLPEDEQAKFMAWQKGWMKKGINFINISHSRKSAQGQKANSKGADLSEEDMHGHSSIFKSSGINLIIQRNKEAEDPIERNTTICKMTKARGVGETGIVGKYYYENEKHKLWDLDDYLSNNPQQF